MKECGKMIYNTDQDLKLGRIVVNMKEITLKGEKKEEGIIVILRKYTWADKSEFDGDWVDNKITGHGVYSWPDGRKYEGDWLENNMNGQGNYVWLDGRSYNGEYAMDKKDGYGVYTWVLILLLV